MYPIRVFRRFRGSICDRLGQGAIVEVSRSDDGQRAGVVRLVGLGDLIQVVRERRPRVEQSSAGSIVRVSDAPGASPANDSCRVAVVSSIVTRNGPAGPRPWFLTVICPMPNSVITRSGFGPAAVEAVAGPP